MRDEPSGAALLHAARRALIDEVVPGLEGRPRYVALMGANAIGIASRELGAADPDGTPLVTADSESLTQAIRAGAHDGDAVLFESLRAANVVASAIWKPPARS